MEKVVLITGATSGIGKSTAKILAQNGFKVYATGREISKAEELINLGIELEYLNLEDEESMKNVVNKIIHKEGKIDVLVNNAGYGIAGSVEDIPIEEAEKQFEVNLFGQIRLTKFVIPYMRKQNGGKIINITSVASLLPSPILSWYSASKVAFSFISMSMRAELRKFGIDVVEVAPSGIRTNWPITASQYLQKFSQNSIYKDITDKIFSFFENSIKTSPSPDVVAKKIIKIIKKKRTKPRYFVPFYANFVYIALKVTPYSIIDKIYKIFFK
ncbi:MAG: SDR family NAD(P)-dependent oxidoreductase [Brevinematia bacterium]